MTVPDKSVPILAACVNVNAATPVSGLGEKRASAGRIRDEPPSSYIPYSARR